MKPHKTTETPRTDAKWTETRHDDGFDRALSMLEFAEQLEKELNEAKKALDQMNQLFMAR